MCKGENKYRYAFNVHSQYTSKKEPDSQSRWPKRLNRYDNVDIIGDLNMIIEKAELSWIPRCENATAQGIKVIVLLSNGTDDFVPALYYCALLKAHGTQEVWMRAGVGNTTRCTSKHILSSNMGLLLCRVLPAMNILIGTDGTTKIGTISTGLKL